MTSGLIYIAIIGMWVAYFAPRWLHDHNEFSGKSVERFKKALRVVANQSPQIVDPSGAIHIDLDREAKVRQTYLRRRIIFFLILFSLTATFIGGVMNKMPFLYLLVPLSAALLYVVNVRRQMNADQLHKRRVNQSHRRSSGISATNLAEVLQPKESNDHWIPLSERELKSVVLLPKGSAQVRNAWEPIQIPSPTYVNAAKAIKVQRDVDQLVQSQISEEQVKLELEALAAASPSRSEIFDQQLAEEAADRLNQIRAANE